MTEISDLVELTFETDLSPEVELGKFLSKIVYPNKGTQIESINEEKSTPSEFSNHKTYSYQILDSSVSQEINKTEKYMKFQISGKNKTEVFKLIKQIYSGYKTK